MVTKPLQSQLQLEEYGRSRLWARGGGGHETMALVSLPLAMPIGLSPLHILTLCGPKVVLAPRWLDWFLPPMGTNKSKGLCGNIEFSPRWGPREGRGDVAKLTSPYYRDPEKAGVL